MDAVFAGRSAELDLLDASLVARDSRPSFVLIEGTGGIGKTALLHAFASRFPAGEVVRATGDEGETALPFAMLDQLTSRLAEVAWSGAPLDSVRERNRAAASREVFSEGFALLDLMIIAQRARPIVMVIDDAHLVDRQSLAAITFALRRLGTERVLVVLTVRPEDAARLPAGLGRLADAGGTRIPLGPLSSAEVREVAARVGFGELTARGADRLHEHSGGNPLHLHTLMADLTLAQVESVLDVLPTPRSLARSVSAALGQTHASTQRLAAAAAVLGPRARLRDSAWLGGVEDTLSAVEQLQDAGLADLQEDHHGELLVFDHPLVRSAVYDGIGAATRAALHTRAASLCSGADALRHRVAAAVGPDDVLAAALCAQADRERLAGAWHSAAKSIFDAVRVSSPGPDRDRLFMDAVELLLLDGDIATATGYIGKLRVLPDSAQRLQLQARLAWLSGRHDEAEQLARAAWELADELPAPTRDTVAAMVAQMCITRNDGAAAALWAKRALAAGQLPPGLAGATRGAGAVGLALAGRPAEGMRLLESLPADAWAVSLEQRLALPARGMLRLWSDDVEGARADLQVSVQTVSRQPEPYLLVALGYLAETEYRGGDWDQAAVLSEQAVTLVHDTEQAWLLAFAHSVAVFVPASRGQWARAERHLESARSAAAELGDQASRAYAANAAVHLATCRQDAAGVVEASAWLCTDGPGGTHEPGIFGWAPQYLVALLDLRRLDEAADTLTRFERVAKQRHHRSRLAALARVRGELAARRRDLTAARAAFEDAVHLGEGAADALESAVIQAAYARFLRRRGERRAAIERFEKADRMFADLGAEPFRRRCRRELAACGVPGQGGTAQGYQRLTPQESAVAKLVCAGYTNRQVADQLTLSVKTVGYHLGHIYRKLDVTSRTQLAARVRAGESGPPG